MLVGVSRVSLALFIYVIEYSSEQRRLKRAEERGQDEKTEKM